MTKKRKFGLDTTSLSTSSPVLDNGLYAGELVGASIENKEHVSFFKVRKERVWDKDSETMVDTGDYELCGMLMYSVMLTSKKAIKELQRDEPRIFGGMIFFNFDKKTNEFLDNPQLGQLLKVFGLEDTKFDELVDFEEDKNIEVPEEFSNVPNIVEMLNWVEFYRAFFTVVCQSINNLPCTAKVVKQPNRDNKEIQENSLDMGSRNAPFCGLLPPVEGSEEDLEV